MLVSDLRPLFPVTETRSYLRNGGMAPAARPVTAAVDEWSSRWAYDPDSIRRRETEDGDAVRERLARLLAAEPDEIALTDTTTRGNNLIVQMIAAPAGSNIVVDGTTYRSQLQPWLLPDRRHVEIRFAAPDAGSVDAFAAAADGRTVAVVVSHVSPLTGFRHDLAALAEVARARGAYLVVDAAQSAGAVALDPNADGVDFLSGTAMKWLLGPPGVGFMFVGRRLVDRLPPPHVGYFGADDPVFAGGDADLVLRPGGRRHELGIGSLLGLAAWRHGLDLLLAVGAKAVEARIGELTDRCIAAARQRSLPLRTPEDPRQRAGLVALEVEDAPGLAEFLRRRGVDALGAYPPMLRVDPHAFNNDDDLDRFFDGMDEFARRGGGGEPCVLARRPPAAGTDAATRQEDGT